MTLPGPHSSHPHRTEQRKLLERLHAAAYTCDFAGRITCFNQRAVALWGRQPMIGSAADRYCGSDKLASVRGDAVPHERCWMALALLENQAYLGQLIVVVQPGGTRKTALAHAHPFHNQRGGVTGAVNVLIDVTGRPEHEHPRLVADGLNVPMPELVSRLQAHANAERVGRLRVLVVDDEYLSALSLAQVLEGFEHEVCQARDGLAALDIGERFKPDVVLMDMVMPKLDGCQTAQRIRAQTWGADIALIAITGHSQEEHRHSALAAGFDHHLIKPIQPDALATLLARCLNDRS